MFYDSFRTVASLFYNVLIFTARNNFLLFFFFNLESVAPAISVYYLWIMLYVHIISISHCYLQFELIVKNLKSLVLWATVTHINFTMRYVPLSSPTRLKLATKFLHFHVCLVTPLSWVSIFIIIVRVFAINECKRWDVVVVVGDEVVNQHLIIAFFYTLPACIHSTWHVFLLNYLVLII